MSLSYGGAYLLPGMGTEYTTQEQQIWFGREEQQLFMGAVLDATATDDGNTSYTHILRPGLALGMIASTKKLVEWDPYATNGSQHLFGFFCGQQNMQQYGAAAERLVGQILVRGNVYASRLLYNGLTTYGIAGTDYEFLLRRAMEGRFFVDDEPSYGLMTWKNREITAASTNVSTERINRVIFTNLGSAAGNTLILPAPKPGMQFIVHGGIAAFNITLDGPGTGEYNTGDNTEVIDKDNTQMVLVEAVRVATTPTYRYLCRAMSPPIAEA